MTNKTTDEATTDENTLDGDNPFAAASSLPFGLPPFAAVRTEHYLPAFQAGMAQQRAQIEAIATSTQEPTVANTLDAIESSGRLLTRTANVFYNLTSSSSTPELAAVESAVAPVLSAHNDAIYLDKRLFARVHSLYERRASLALTTEQERLLERYHTDFVRAGAALDEADQERLRAVNAELSTLTTAFKNDLLSDTNELAVHVGTREELDGLSDAEIAAAQAAAISRGLDEGYLLTLVLPTEQPALASLRNRSVRERLHRASVSRGLRGNDFDTRATLTRLVTLRAERARLLGYDSHAAYVVADQTAPSVDAVLEMLGGLVGPAVTNARAEAADHEAALVADGQNAPLQPWDWAYYARVVRDQRFDLDAAALKPYFELQRVVHDGIFYAANALYGLSFTRREDLVAHDPDAEVYEVTRTDESGVSTSIGLFVADWFARASKRGGAWMSSFVDQSHLLDERPVIVINLNIPQPPAGEPALLTLDEVETAFHEFGHVLHGLLSDVRYPRLSGTSVPRDFVEFPSQVNEMWAYWPQVLAHYAVHHESGEPLAQEVMDRLLAAREYGQGFATTEYLAATLLDLEWHRRSTDDPPVLPEDVESFESDALSRNGISYELVPPRYRSTYFAHVFAGGYSAGYYGYIWSEVLDADMVEWFTENGGLTRSNGETFARELLSRGGSVDPLAAFEAVRGRAAVVGPLLKRRGLSAS